MEHHSQLSAWGVWVGIPANNSPVKSSGDNLALARSAAIPLPRRNARKSPRYQRTLLSTAWCPGRICVSWVSFSGPRKILSSVSLDRETESVDPKSVGLRGDVSPSKSKQGLTLPSPQPRALARRAAQRVRASIRPEDAPARPSRRWNCGSCGVFVERTSAGPPSSPHGTIVSGTANDVCLASHLSAGWGPGEHGLRSLSSNASVALAAWPAVGGFHAHPGFCLFVDASLRC